MNGRQLTDAQISKALRAHLPDRAYPGLRERILDAAETTGQQRALPSVIGALSEADPVVRRRSLLIAAALLVALALASAAAVGALRLLQRDPIRDLSLQPPPAPSVATPSPGASSSPSPTTAALTWTQASLDEDWPAPVRPEPAGAAIVRPILLKDVVDNPALPLADQGHSLRSGRYTDPTGDTGSAVFPWVDIREVGFCGTACLVPTFVSNVPVVDPTEQWIAYGVVFDTDRDGVADWRYGVDNMPVDPSGVWEHRAWRTDLHTGQTESAAGPPYGSVGKTFFDTFYPTRWNFGGDAAGGGPMSMTFDVPFYVWASVILDGRVVATDYAPDVGWLLPSPDAKP
jgi:hypothetical protein